MQKATVLNIGARPMWRLSFGGNRWRSSQLDRPVLYWFLRTII